MKQEPRLVIRMGKQLGWAHKLGGAKSLEICKASRTVLARLIESQIWHQLAGSVALCGEGLEKGQWPLLVLIPDTSVSPLYTTGAFQGATLVLELRGSESE